MNFGCPSVENRKRTILVILFAISYFVPAKSQSYEGYISDNLPVWMDLKQPATAGSVSGSYFYKKNGGSISLSGTIKGNSIVLNEKNNSGAVVGTFTCTMYKDSITGNWKKLNSNKSISVKLYKTDPSYKNVALIPGADKLMLAKGTTLNDEMKDMVSESGNMPKLNYSFAEKGVLSTNFDWESIGAYATSGTEYHTFNLANNKEISFAKEIDPAMMPKFKEKIKLQIQKQLDTYKKSYSEQEWIDVFGDKETYEKAFNVSELPDYLFDRFFIKKKYIQINIQNYFGFPHAAQGMDFNTEFKIPFSELNPYLNKNSVLKKLN